MGNIGNKIIGAIALQLGFDTIATMVDPKNINQRRIRNERMLAGAKDENGPMVNP